MFVSLTNIFMANCPKCNTEVEDMDQHAAEAHADEGKEESAGDDQ